MTDATSALAANREFYRAFAARDVAAMERLWADKAPIACVHPGWDVLEGRAAVLQSWRDILGHAGAPQISCRHDRVIVHDRTALVLCHEVLADGVLMASNMFVLEEGRWRMVHHQASPLAMSAPAEPAPAPRSLH